MDVLLAIALGITVLVITLPTTLSLMKHLWPPFGQEAFAAAMAISVLNGIALGVPLAVTIWRWRERIAEGHRDSTLIPRDYWQVQAYVLFPVLLCSWLFLSFYSLLTMRCFGGPPM